ncbi:protein of unknown function DUF255 [Thioalkalivibrio nitratireducens DSM 14787]|uniref:Thioredoxin domain-containing protein n=1 Tax=Thioalkalivibrio nitratireducens (strain DSM 14787 / UNIQEM 213 / ALEN2) TaxID=1255043 RepID=L0DXN2_THIND|nr:protein of unknown function DUF255 [Thioalkalivibrio nitratireducens DSM 14787]
MRLRRRPATARRTAVAPVAFPHTAAAGLWLLLTLLLASLATAAGQAALPDHDYPRSSQIGWHSFAPALFTRARAENRPLFLYFHGQWCTWCRDFQDDSLEHPTVVEVLERDYIPVLIDLDRRRDLFTRYGGRGLPFVVILDANEDVRGRFTGHVGPSDLAQVLAERRRQISVTGRELTPDDEPIDTVEGFLAMLGEVYDPAADRLSGSAMFGTLSKRPQPWTYSFLLRQDAWRSRMPGLLDRLVADLADPEDGGFFFFYDPDQTDPDRARETSKRLEQNAAFLWLFSDAYAEFGLERHRTLVRRSLNYLKNHLWDTEERRFYTSQYSDNFYYAQPRAVRDNLAPPPVDRTTYADASGQAIAALLRAANALDDPALVSWAGEALDGLDERLRSRAGYLHALPEDGPAELEGYLPAQVWPGIAWHLYRGTTADRDNAREREILAAIAAFHDPGLGGYRERIGSELEPWVEVRTQAALAWWLARLPDTVITAAGIDPDRVHAHLRLVPGADPDDAALGFWALERASPAPAATPAD